MGAPKNDKTKEIKTLYQKYCKEHLDGEYLRLCNDLFDELLMYDENIFKRGRPNIWAAAIVWAIGSINFLGDKTFEPYASLKDVCAYFDTNSSTVGQKASSIKDDLDIDRFTSEYLHENNTILDFFKNLVITESGLIIPRNLLENNEEAIYEDEELTDEDEVPDNYIIIIEARNNMKQANLYELEYLFKKVLSEDEYLKKIFLTEPKKIQLHYYGRPYKVSLFENKLQQRLFDIVELVNDISK
ncbi:MAG: hypothetical protein GXO86_02325 [Chlorobi bacterium]|nr:hypothetical protein [Chlorobiota bacterium]